MSNPADLLRGVQGLASFESVDLGSALAAAENTARQLVAEEHWGADTFTAAPEGARWTVDELQQQLLYQQAYQPQGDVRLVTIAYAHLMDARLHDHLLKIVEEPPAPVLFLFVVDNSDNLPITLQSRIYRRIHVEPRSVEQLTSEIHQAAGEVPAPAVVRVSQKAPTLAAALAGEKASEVLTHCTWFVNTLQERGFTAGFKATKTLKDTSRAVSGGSAEAPKTRAAQREILRAGLQLLSESQLHRLEHGTLPEAQDAAVRMDRIDQALNLSEAHLPADQVLVYALTGGEAHAA